MKAIKAFINKIGRGHYIDYTDAPCAISVTPNSGDVLLNEGRGSDRLPRCCIPGSCVDGFSLRPVEDGFEVTLAFRAVDGPDSLGFGVTTEKAAAEAWIQVVNSLYVKQR